MTRIRGKSSRRVEVVAVLAVVAVFCSVGDAASGAASAAECGNESRRLEQHATYLSECRAYELVSPVGAIPTERSHARASVAAAGAYAGAIAWASVYPYPGAATDGIYFLSTRGSAGWTTVSTTPSHTGDAEYIECKPFIFYSTSLEAGIVSANRETDAVDRAEQEYCAHTEPWPLVAGEPGGVQNLFLHDIPAGKYSLVNGAPLGEGPAAIATFQDGSADLGAVLFSEEARLTPEAPAGEDLYERTGGTLVLVSVLPDGVPTPGNVAHASSHTPERGLAPPVKPIGGAPTGAAPFLHAVSANGSRVLFETEGKLYLRINAAQAQSKIDAAHEAAVNGEQCEEAGKACTIQVDASGSGTLLWANEEDTKIFFMDDAGAHLTADTEAGSGENLYEYSLASGQAVGTMTNLTAKMPTVDVDGVSGFGENEAHAMLYFVADGVLSGANGAGAEPQAEKPNLYLLEEGHSQGHSLTFIATLASQDTHDWAGSGTEEFEHLWAEASPSGQHFAFSTVAKLSAYENTDAGAGVADREIYLYEAAAKVLRCVSCDPSGAPPHGGSFISVVEQSGRALSPGYLRRTVLDDGAVFFESPDPLVTRDINGQEDVYEYKAGELRLVSSGTATDGSFFVEATPDGGNVFFLTAQELVKLDTDNVTSLYDARREGGLAEPPSPAPPCASGEECRGLAFGPPRFLTLSSIAFSGVGNQTSTNGRSKKGKTGGSKAKTRLTRALRACERRFPRAASKRRACIQRARRRYGGQATTKRYARPHKHLRPYHTGGLK